MTSKSEVFPQQIKQGKIGGERNHIQNRKLESAANQPYLVDNCRVTRLHTRDCIHRNCHHHQTSGRPRISIAPPNTHHRWPRLSCPLERRVDLQQRPSPNTDSNSQLRVPTRDGQQLPNSLSSPRQPPLSLQTAATLRSRNGSEPSSLLLTTNRFH
ncbi:unnamed protein product [Vicia faba]|uniref:Uncharacterized protein n=1 Tax=Vicia faba TaxID=3906 RepID=A0AAV0YNU1_VICFA|nr:unnamed protein product [Vicia faba]